MHSFRSNNSKTSVAPPSLETRQRVNVNRAPSLLVVTEPLATVCVPARVAMGWKPKKC